MIRRIKISKINLIETAKVADVMKQVRDLNLNYRK